MAPSASLDPLLALSSGRSRISPRWGCQPSGSANIQFFAQFSQKLHEIERIWTPGAVPCSPLDLLLLSHKTDLVTECKYG